MSKQSWKRPAAPEGEVPELALYTPAEVVPDYVPAPEPTITVQAWASTQGAKSTLVQAFVRTRGLGRVVKQSAAAWAALYQEFLTQPRG